MGRLKELRNYVDNELNMLEDEDKRNIDTRICEKNWELNRGKHDA